MNRAPAFQFYPKDWQDFKVQRMSLAAQGAYMKVLCFMWADSHDQCSIVDDDKLIATAVGATVEQWLEFRREIQNEFDPILEQKSGRLISSRLKHESVKQRNYRKLQAEKGKRSAQQRLNRGSTAVQPMHQPQGNSSSSSSSSSSDFQKEEKRDAGSTHVEPADGAKRKGKLSDEDFVDALRNNPAYQHFDVDIELGKLDAWLLSPRGHGKKKTRQRIINWLNKAADDHREVKISASRSSAMCIWRVENGRHRKPCGKPITQASARHCDDHLPLYNAERARIAELNQEVIR